MNWFSKLIGTKGLHNSAKVLDPMELNAENDVNVLEDLFVNKQDPTAGLSSQPDESATLKSYLEQDFFRKGLGDGYTYHSAEMLENMIKSMKAEFRFTLSQKIDQLKQDIVKLENHRIEVEGMSEKLVRQIDNQINAHKAIITDLESEIAMSALDEGLAMIGIHQYRDGFLRGTDDYQQEKFLASSTGLFN